MQNYVLSVCAFSIKSNNGITNAMPDNSGQRNICTKTDMQAFIL